MIKEEQYYVSFETAAGWIGFSGTYRGIAAATLPCESREQTILSLRVDVSHAIYSLEYFKFPIEEMMAYFNGYRVDFSVRIDISGATSFERAVWETTRQIPYGETRSYSWIARHIDRPQAARAVGQALGRNPLPVIVPCHRVLTSDGKLGGFGGGLEMKKFLLRLETKKSQPLFEREAT